MDNDDRYWSSMHDDIAYDDYYNFGSPEKPSAKATADTPNGMKRKTVDSPEPSTHARATKKTKGDTQAAKTGDITQRSIPHNSASVCPPFCLPGPSTVCVEMSDPVAPSKSTPKRTTIQASATAAEARAARAPPLIDLTSPPKRKKKAATAPATFTPTAARPSGSKPAATASACKPPPGSSPSKSKHASKTDAVSPPPPYTSSSPPRAADTSMDGVITSPDVSHAVPLPAPRARTKASAHKLVVADLDAGASASAAKKPAAAKKTKDATAAKKTKDATARSKKAEDTPAPLPAEPSTTSVASTSKSKRIPTFIPEVGPDPDAKRRIANACTPEILAAVNKAFKVVRPGGARLELKKINVGLKPSDYVFWAMERLAELPEDRRAAIRKRHWGMKGKVIFYYDAEATFTSENTRGRILLLLINGATVQPAYDPQTCTHIVLGATISLRTLLKALRYTDWRDIPEHIPTLRWPYLTFFTSTKDPPDASEDKSLILKHAAFEERKWIGTEVWEVQKRKWERERLEEEQEEARALTGPSSDGVEVISDFKHTKGKGRAHSRSSSCDDYLELADSDNDSNFDEDSEEELRRRKGERRRKGKQTAGSRRLEAQTAAARAFALKLKAKDVANAAPQEGGGPGPSMLSPPTSPVAGERADKGKGKAAPPVQDPLAEFYEQAQEEHDLNLGLSSKYEEVVSETEDETDDKAAETPLAVVPKTSNAASTSKWVCDNKYARGPKECINQDVVDKLSELEALHKVKSGEDHHWRGFSTGKAVRAISSYPKRIKSREEALKIFGVGDKIADKIMEIIRTGQLRRIGYEHTEDVDVLKNFMGIYGVGKTIAQQMYNAGCRGLEDVRARKGGIKLTPAMEIGLKYYDDINDRMPREEAGAIFGLIKAIALKLDRNLFIEIMGSFRRGKLTCGDIDVLITRPTDDGKTHAGILPRLLRRLKKAGIVTEDLTMPGVEEAEGLEGCYRGLCRLPDVPNSKRRRIDFLTVPWECKGGALLYYTGDNVFNCSMRLKANRMGFSLNQRGLYADVIRNPSNRREKLDKGHRIAGETEEEIFEKLGVPWQEPHERVRARTD